MDAVEASSHKTVQNPGTTTWDAVDKNAAVRGLKTIHRFPHPLKGSIP